MQLEDTVNILWDDIKASIDNPPQLEIALDEFKATVLEKAQEMTENEKQVLKSDGPLPDANNSYLRLAMQLLAKALGDSTDIQAFLPSKNEVEQIVENVVAKSLSPLHQEMLTTKSIVSKLNTEQITRKVMIVENDKASAGKTPRPTAEEYIHQRLSQP